MNSTRKLARPDWNCFKFTWRLTAVWLLAMPLFLSAQHSATELNFTAFNNQGAFNNFSGDHGIFAAGQASIKTSFDTTVFHGTNGASLRIDYAVPLGYCGGWSSLIGKDEFGNQMLNFTNLYDGLRNSRGNPSRVENVRITNFSFWARGNGIGDFNHTVKVEFNGESDLHIIKDYTVTNQTNWLRFDFPISELGTNDLSRMKEVLFVIEDWQNARRTNYFFLD